MSELNKNSIAIRVSREMLLDLGMVEPTRQERADRDAEMEQFRQQRAASELAEAEAWSGLLERCGDDARLVLDLHSPGDESYWRTCQGCDFGGYDAEEPDWPCRTVLALAEAHGIEWPR